ncbi:hypothetical protein ACFV4P_34545 [Kitasatospora sp. NPDC059795]|uniref:hypothetical protein n=1 Tax=Kitasatospora sp. NPDC059795 TaxID=3346949 RepID=UPI003653A5B7
MTLAVKSLPAIAARLRTGTDIAVVARTYGCEAKWLGDQLVKSRLPFDPDGSRPLGPPSSWEVIPLPARTTRPRC